MFSQQIESHNLQSFNFIPRHLHNWAFGGTWSTRTYALNGKLHIICKSNDQKSFVWLKFYRRFFLLWQKTQVKYSKEDIATLFTEFTWFGDELERMKYSLFLSNAQIGFRTMEIAMQITNASNTEQMKKFCECATSFSEYVLKKRINVITRIGHEERVFTVERAT